MKYIMSDGSRRSLDQLRDDHLFNELRYEFLHGDVGGKVLAILDELKKRLAKDTAFKALKLAAQLLADQLGKCPKCLCWLCPGGDKCTASFADCWFAYLWEKAVEG